MGRNKFSINRKPPDRAFYFFAMERKAKKNWFRHLRIRKRFRVRSGNFWKYMKVAQRIPYKEQAKKEEMQSGNFYEKFREEWVKYQKSMVLKKQMETVVKRGFSDNTFADQKYNFIHANYIANSQ